MKKLLGMFLLLVLACIAPACAVQPVSESDTASTSEALTTEQIHVQPGTAQMVSPKGHLPEDPAHPTPNLTGVTVISGGTVSTYSITTHTSIVGVTSTQFSSINTQLAAAAANPTLHHVDCAVTYDPATVGNNKTVTSFSCTLI